MRKRQRKGKSDAKNSKVLAAVVTHGSREYNKNLLGMANKRFKKRQLG
jgi:hypothetical protein